MAFIKIAAVEDALENRRSRATRVDERPLGTFPCSSPTWKAELI